MTGRKFKNGYGRFENLNIIGFLHSSGDERELGIKKTAKATITDKHHPIFSITSPDPYIWDGWIYIGIQ